MKKEQKPNIETLLSLAKTKIKDNTTFAEHAIQSILKDDPEHYEALVLRIECYFWQQKDAEALTEIEKLLLIRSEDHRLFYYKAIIFSFEKQYEKACGLVNKAIQHAGEEVPISYYFERLRCQTELWKNKDAPKVHEIVEMIADTIRVLESKEYSGYGSRKIIENNMYMYIESLVDVCNSQRMSVDVEVIKKSIPSLFDPWEKRIRAHIALINSSYYISPHDLAFISYIDEGTFGTVYQGDYRGTKVAIKVLNNSSAIESFQCEVGLMNKLKHENIVEFIGASFRADEYVKGFCIVTKFMSHGSLYSYLTAHNVLSWGEKIGFALDIARGLEYMHSENILHGDIKAENVLVNQDLKAVLSDFGLSSEIPASGKVKKRAGTPQWMAPETWQKNILTEQTDVYGLAMFLWELINRDRKNAEPYSAEMNVKEGGILIGDHSPESNTSVAKWVIHGHREKFSKGTPKFWQKFIKSGWNGSPQARPRMGEMVTILCFCEYYLKSKVTQSPATFEALKWKWRPWDEGSDRRSQYNICERKAQLAAGAEKYQIFDALVQTMKAKGMLLTEVMQKAFLFAHKKRDAVLLKILGLSILEDNNSGEEKVTKQEILVSIFTYVAETNKQDFRLLIALPLEKCPDQILVKFRRREVVESIFQAKLAVAEKSGIKGLIDLIVVAIQETNSILIRLIARYSLHSKLLTNAIKCAKSKVEEKEFLKFSQFLVSEKNARQNPQNSRKVGMFSEKKRVIEMEYAKRGEFDRNQP